METEVIPTGFCQSPELFSPIGKAQDISTMESLAPRLRGLLLLIMARVYIGGDLQGPPEKTQSKTKMEESR
jgi:hypothetical protein